ncbi:MAG: hypothetical protein S4CHLAM45_13960 [Chlamydiales bacterium]|nr:hypothetical protein [Chlamydiales bacterium]MCH9620501.1 hypothetical protein [Chlamydiales bacterium]MCH9623486.1 hypothetical protein [Chlamydiales bacterium]
MKIDEIQQITDEVDGFLSQNGDNLLEGETLYYLAKKYAPGGDVAEIGSWKGKSTIWLANGCRGTKSHVYAIDHHEGSPEHQSKENEVWTFEEFKQNIANASVTDYVIPVVKKSKEALSDTGELNLLFIDGAHEYDAVKEDLNLWFPKVKEGGCIAFHDTSLPGWSGVRKLVIEEVFKSPHFTNIRYINSITYATKKKHISLKEKLKNRIALFVNQVHQVTRIRHRFLKSLAKHLIWGPFHKRWFHDLKNVTTEG